VAKEVPKYQTLGQSFFRGGFDGQLNSCVKYAKDHPGETSELKGKEFAQALADGDVTWPAEITSKQKETLERFGAVVPASVSIKVREVKNPAAAPVAEPAVGEVVENAPASEAVTA